MHTSNRCSKYAGTEQAEKSSFDILLIVGIVYTTNLQIKHNIWIIPPFITIIFSIGITSNHMMPEEHRIAVVVVPNLRYQIHLAQICRFFLSSTDIRSARHPHYFEALNSLLTDGINGP